MPPDETIRAFIADLAAHGVTVDRSTMERDLDRVMFGVQSRASTDLIMQDAEAELQRAYEKSAGTLSPVVRLITEAIERHFSGYFEWQSLHV